MLLCVLQVWVWSEVMDDYDSLSASEQSLVLARWATEIDRALAELDLQAEFEAAGTPYATLDADGRVVVRYPTQRSGCSSQRTPGARGTRSTEAP
jgi:hypothetical protein